MQIAKGSKLFRESAPEVERYNPLPKDSKELHLQLFDWIVSLPSQSVEEARKHYMAIVGKTPIKEDIARIKKAYINGDYVSLGFTVMHRNENYVILKTAVPGNKELPRFTIIKEKDLLK